MFHPAALNGKAAIKKGKNRVLYLQFWSAFAKEWAGDSRNGKADSDALLLPVCEVVPENKKINIDLLKVAQAKALSRAKLADAALQQKANKLLDDLAPLLKNTCEEIAISKIIPQIVVNEKYECLTEYGTQILCLLKANEGCTYLSRNFEKLTSHSAAAQYGNEFFQLIHPDFRDKLRAMLPSCNSAAQQETLRLKLQHADGKYYWYQFAIHPKNDQLRDAAYVCIIENINDNMQVQATLQKARLEAELALRARSEFLANMSHELRTPLNAVIGFSQIMESGILGKIENAHHAEYIKNIRESGHDLLAKIEDLLEIADIDAGRISLSREEIYVNDLIKHVLQTQAHHASAKKVSLSYVPKGNMLLFVDRLKLQHILGHLLSNAIKFNKAGGEVTIEIKRAPKCGINIAVHDSGEGMSDIKCYDIREALGQESCWTAKDSHHIGIGLALTKEVIGLHDGAVDITSSAGIGTTVSFTLPRSCLRISPTKKEEPVKAKFSRRLEDRKQLEIV